MNKTELKKVVLGNKNLEDIIQKIDVFKNLSHPTQKRIQNMMRTEEINCYGQVPITNGICSDFIYVCSGQLKIDFIKRISIDGEAIHKSEILVQGDYIDDVWKRKSFYNDYSIRRITAMPHTGKSVNTNEETVF